MDFYQILSIEYEATSEEIKSAYRKLALEFHPDRNPGDKAASDKFKQISEAYSVLSDHNKKVAYDHRLVKPKKKPAPPKPPEPKQKPNISPTTRFGDGNLMIHLAVTAEELKKGCTKIVTYEKREVCIKCGGDGELYVSCPICSGTTLIQICPVCKDAKEVLIKCKTCNMTGLDMLHETQLTVKVKPNSFSGMQLTFPGEGEMVPRKIGMLRVVLVQKI